MSNAPSSLDVHKLKRAGIVGAAVLLVVLATGTVSRVVARHGVAAWTAAQAIPTVSVIHPTASRVSALILPGRIQAWQAAPIYARTNGYLRKWYADIGTHVHAGDLLAEIDAPDLDQQLAAASAALATADAQRDIAARNSARSDRLVGTAVSQQQAEERRADLAAREAMRNEARANLERLRAMAGFKRIVAPFDGVVTSRAADVGTLIAGGDSHAVPLFTVSDTRKLRIYVNVPQNFLAGIQPGTKARFTVPEHNTRTFTAEVTRTAEALSTQSGAMLTELVVDNGEGLLKPGGYAQVTLEVSADAPTAVRVKASALLFREEGMAVAIVGRDEKITVKAVQVGQDFGAEVEIAAGLTLDDRIVDGPSDAIATGDHVRVAEDEAVKSRSSATGDAGESPH